MKILYVANHNNGQNDDEGAIAWAFENLGHTVKRIPEAYGQVALEMEGDLLLFHKWMPPVKPKIPSCFWYFDLVDFPDPTLHTRCAGRKQWMEQVIPLVDIGFCTDGDWALKHPKLHTLRQGADWRNMGRGVPMTDKYIPILMLGISSRGGQTRVSFVEEMKQRYGSDFVHIPSGVHGKPLADLIATSRIVVAPDGPVTDRYWSNRVYLMLGFGAFLLHPLCGDLQNEYTHKSDLVYYRNRKDLHAKIDFYLPNEADRNRIANYGQATTYHHTYTNRCSQLLKVVKERLGVG